MRRKSSLILLVAAVFCVALAPLLREFVFPRLVTASLGGRDAYRVVVLEANNATLIGAPEGPGKARITAVRTIRPDAKAGKDGTVVWDVNLAVLDGSGKVVTRFPERYAFDAATQTPKNCCGEQIDGAPAAHTGFAYKFPYFVEKRDYNYYDSRAHAANVISYKGTADRDGLKTYRFEQQVPWMKIPMPKQLPGDLDPVVLEKEGMQLWYTVTRKMWVEPVTGSPVYVEETHQEELRSSPPSGQVDAQPTVTPVFEGTFTIKPAWSAALIADAKDEKAKLEVLHNTLPLGLLVLGVAMFLSALVSQFMANHGLRLKREARERREAREGVPVVTGAGAAGGPVSGAADVTEVREGRGAHEGVPAEVGAGTERQPVSGAADVTEVLPSVPAESESGPKPEPVAEPQAEPEPEPQSETAPAPEPGARGEGGAAPARVAVGKGVDAAKSPPAE